MNKYIFTLIIPILFIGLIACDNTVMVSSSKYCDYIKENGVHQNVADLNVARMFPLSKIPTGDGELNQENVYKNINEVEANEVTVVTTMPEILKQIGINNDIGNLTATAPAELVESAKPPRTAWTEVEYIKTMYTNVACTSYRYALYTSYQVTYYDMGCALSVIGITSTGFYRLSNDRYVPCEYLTENLIFEPSATSRAVVYYD